MQTTQKTRGCFSRWGDATPRNLHAIETRLASRTSAKTKVDRFDEDVQRVLLQLTDQMKADIFGQFCSHQWKATKAQDRSIDDSTINKQLLMKFETAWNDFDARLRMVPGKKLLAMFNVYLSEKCGVSLTPTLIIGCHKKGEIPAEMDCLLAEINAFRSL